MKYIKMRVRHTPIPGGGQFQYPKGYDAQKVVIGPVYEPMADRSQRYCDMIFGVDEDDFAQFMALNGEKVEGHTFYCIELSEEEMIQQFEAFKPNRPTEDVPDPFRGKVMAILAKSARGVALSQQERDALDPEHPEHGVHRVNTHREWVVTQRAAHDRKKNG
jgi:hypothetical protein